MPAAEIDSDAKAAFFSVHALKDTKFADKFKKMLAAGKPVLITDGLTKRLENINRDDENLIILKVGGNPHNLLKLTRKELEPIRNKLLAPFGIRFDAPNKVGLYLIGDNCLIVENFNDESIDVSMEFSKSVKARKRLVLPPEGNVEFSCNRGKLKFNKITPRTLVAVEY
ncbi:hypothetical protein ES703_80551 [subsurface metagenome]